MQCILISSRMYSWYTYVSQNYYTDLVWCCRKIIYYLDNKFCFYSNIFRIEGKKSIVIGCILPILIRSPRSAITSFFRMMARLTKFKFLISKWITNYYCPTISLYTPTFLSIMLHDVLSHLEKNTFGKKCLLKKKCI